MFQLVLACVLLYKMKIHSSRCEIEDFVETHLCKLCVILRSRALRVVYDISEESHAVGKENDMTNVLL